MAHDDDTERGSAGIPHAVRFIVLRRHSRACGRDGLCVAHAHAYVGPRLPTGPAMHWAPWQRSRLQACPLRGAPFTMSWPSNANVGHDWLLDEWPWDPLSLGLALDWTGGARHNLISLNSNSAHASPVQPRPVPVAPGDGAQPTTLKRDRRASRPRPAGGPDARGAKQARLAAAAVCRVPGCGVAMDSLSTYCKRTRSVLLDAHRALGKHSALLVS